MYPWTKEVKLATALPVGIDAKLGTFLGKVKLSGIRNVHICHVTFAGPS